MGWLKKARSQLSLKNIKRSTTTLKGIRNVTKNVVGIGVLERSKTARKAALIGVAATGAYFAAPYAVGAGKFAAAKTGSIFTKIGAVAGNVLSRRLAPGQVGDMVGPPEQSSPTEDNFYNNQQTEPEDYAASQRLPYGAAASAGGAASMSSCNTNASEYFNQNQTTWEYFLGTIDWMDGMIFAFVIVALIGLIIDNHFANQFEKKKVFRAHIVKKDS